MNIRRFAFFLIGLLGAAAMLSGAYIALAKRDDHTAEPPTTPSESRREERPPLNLSDDEMREVVEIMNLYTLEKGLRLSQDQLTRVLPNWRKLIEMRSTFWNDRRERLGALEAVLEESPNDEARLLQEVNDFRQEDDDFWASYREFEKSMLAELTAEQKARYILIDSEQPRKASRFYRTLKRINENADEPPAVVGGPTEQPATTTASR